MTAAVLASLAVASPVRLAGATRAEIARALAEIGVPERELRMRTGPALALDLSSRRPRVRGDAQHFASAPR